MPKNDPDMVDSKKLDVKNSEKVDLAVFKEVYEEEVNYIMKRRDELAKDEKSGVHDNFHCKLESQVKGDQERRKNERKRNNKKIEDLEKKQGSMEEEKFKRQMDELKKKKDELRGLEPNVDYNLVGLCFSGGGIRSATFNLGLVQAMAKKGVFKLFDCLSTISGGSYIGACISFLLSQNGTQTYGKKFPFYSKRGEEEKPVIKHLRNYSNFLTPHMGMFSSDTWYMIAIILRGMFLNLIILFSFFIFGLSLAMHALVYRYWKTKPWDSMDGWYPGEYYFPIALTMGVLIMSSLVFPIYTLFKRKYTRKFRKVYGTMQVYMLWAVLSILIIKLLPYGVMYLHSYVNNIVGGISLASLFAIFKYSGTAGKFKGILKRVIPIIIPFFLIGLCIYMMGEWLVPEEDTYSGWTSEELLNWKIKMWWFCGVSFVVFCLFGSIININRNSFHHFYKDKITKAFIFKHKPNQSNESNSSNGEQGVPMWGDDDCLLKDLHSGGNGAPYHLINATLNLAGEDNLNLRGRKADFFLFSKEYCGSEITGFRTTSSFRKEEDVTLGRAVTVSGAAINPQSGSSTVPSISFLMTLMNARVGYWMPNPKESKWRFIFWPWYLIYGELFSRTKANSYLCNLSDGAFIENLGIYQLVKRRCKYIIAVDVGADPDMKFEDLGNALRKVRIDLGVQINLDVEMLRKQAETNLSKWHCVADTIHYSDTEKGIIVYIKSSMTGDEPEDLFHYQKQNPAFPHETTADQWFDEAQFESYRQLGYHVGKKVFDGIDIDDKESSTNDMLSKNFGKLLSKWRPPVPDLSKSFLRNSEKHMELENLIKDNPELTKYDLQNYPELEQLVETENYTLDKRQAIHFCNMQIQLMENVWMALEMDRYYNHPDNRGWMNLFRRWARSETFRMVWSINKGLYGRNFKEFAEARLNLPKSDDENFYVKKPEKCGLKKNIIDEFEDVLKNTQKEKYEEWIEILKNPGKGNGEIWTIKNCKVGGKEKPFVMGIALLTKGNKNPDTMKLEFIIVRDYLQRMGLGKLLFDKILKDLKEEGKITTLYTKIRKDTPKPFKDFYYRLGFRKKKEEEEEKKEQEDKLILEILETKINGQD